MPSELAAMWTLDPAVVHLNHASFGATPRRVLDEQAAWRERMEREPVAFFVRDLEPALDDARRALANFVHADADDLAFVPNATAGVSTVLRSLRIERGDELLTTDHAYNAVRNALELCAALHGGRVVTAPIPFPGTTPEAARDAVLAHVSGRTRLAVLDHVTSASAVVLPVPEIVAELAERGIDTLVDGAHAPGMLDLDVAAIGAAYYTGNCHKWLSAAKGSAFLHVSRDRQHLIRPLATSHGMNSPRTDRSRFRLEHDWVGTLDPSAWLSVPAAIDFGAALLPGGWPALRERSRSLAIAGRDLVCRALGEPAPTTDEMIGSMASVPLAPESDAERIEGISLYGDPVHDSLLEDHGLEVMVSPWPPRPNGQPRRRLVRISAAPYNDIGDMERLARALGG